MRAIVAVSLLQTVLAATISEPISYDTIVVGLGASGVAAASKLAEASKRVLGLEAQDRIGGRVKTVPFGNGVVEVGAEWIHGIEDSVTYDLALKNNVSIQPQGLKYTLCRSDGSPLDEKLIADVIELVMATYDSSPPEPEPLGQFITRKLTEYLREKYPHVLEDKDFFDNLLIYLDFFIDVYESSNSWNDVTTANSYQQLEGNPNMSWHRNGYYTLFKILLNTYKNGPGYPSLEINLGTEVVNIQWPQDPNEKVKVTTKDGAVYTADNVIVTMSIGVLKERYNGLFTPPLPEIKQTAVENISIGKIGKIILCFDPIFWNKDVSYLGFFWRTKDRLEAEREDPWTISIQGLSVSMGATNCITLWVVGDASLKSETLPEEEVKTKAMAILRKFAGKTMNISEPIGMIRTTWHSNPFVRGAYSYDNLDMPKHPNAREDLAAPLVDLAGQPRVLFAGEATNKIHYSTVHGAVETGYREAKRLLAPSRN